jgi:hypothetical protein
MRIGIRVVLVRGMDMNRRRERERQKASGASLIDRTISILDLDPFFFFLT